MSIETFWFEIFSINEIAVMGGMVYTIVQCRDLLGIKSYVLVWSME